MKMYLSAILLASTLVLPAYANSNINASTLPIAAQSNIKQNTKSVTANWSKYTAKDNTYTVLFPKMPTEQNEDGTIIISHFDSAKDIYYFTSASKIPGLGDSTVNEQIFDVYLDFFTKAANAKITSQKSIYYQGLPGREVTIVSTKNNAVLGRIRVIIDKKTSSLYQLGILSQDKSFNVPEISAFFDSLTIN